MEVPGGAKVSNVARVHVAFETDGGDMTKTMAFPYEDAVGALAALGSVRAAAKVEPAAVAAVAAVSADTAATVSFHAEGRGKSFEIEALFCTPHACSEAFEKWAGDVLVATASKSQWMFARFAKPSRITCLSLLAWMETGYLELDEQEVVSDTIRAKMTGTTLPAELSNMCVVTVKAISIEDRRRRIAAITALEAPSDAFITCYYGHFRRPTEVFIYCPHAHDANFASTAFEIRVVFGSVPPDDDDVRQAVTLIVGRMFQTIAQTRTCRFVWSTSERIVQVLARIDSLEAPAVKFNPAVLMNVEVLHKASSLDVSTDAFYKGFNADGAFTTPVEGGVIAVGLNPLSSARLVPLWARAIAHQSPEEQVAAFVNGWIQLP